MSNMTATEPIRVSHTDEDTQVFVMPKSASGFKKKIIEYTKANNIVCSPSRAAKVAIRIARRAEHMQTEFEFYIELRNLGITSDITPRDAEHNLTCSKTECDKCGQTQLATA